jgi:hypothetical protein
MIGLLLKLCGAYNAAQAASSTLGKLETCKGYVMHFGQAALL